MQSTNAQGRATRNNKRAVLAALLSVGLIVPGLMIGLALPAHAAPGDLDSQLVSVTLDGAPYSATGAPFSVAADHAFVVDIVMKNTGAFTWGGDRSTGQHAATLMTREPDHNTVFGTFMIAGGGGTKTGEQGTYHSGLRAPAQPGDYTMKWQLSDWRADDLPWGGPGYRDAPFFGETFTIRVHVTAPTPAPTIPAVPAGVVSVDDFVYQGSFALPEVPGAQYYDDKHYTESGIALRTVNGEQRLLALTGTYGQSLYEVAVPPLGVIAGADTSAVPTATLRTYFGGLPQVPEMGNGTIWYDQATGTFYWENHGNWTPAEPVLRSAKLDSGTLVPVQQWTQPDLPGLAPTTFFGGVTGIPADFASQYTGGRSLALGFGQQAGPSLAAVSAAPSGGDLDFLPIMSSNGDHRTVRDGNFFTTWDGDPQPTDPWTGLWAGNSASRAGVFIDLPDKKGYLTFTTQPVGRIAGDNVDAEIQNTWYVYDYATLGAAATGTGTKLAPTPSSYATVQLPGDGSQTLEYITGSAFDPANRLLYVYARNGVKSGSQPVVHVYRVRESAPGVVSGVPAAMTAGTTLALRATTPATGQTISWSLADAGTTGAALTGSYLTATAAGTATVRATVHTPGAADTTQDFPITVRPASAGAKQITRFTVDGVDGVIDQTTHRIFVTLPFGTDIREQQPDIEFTGATVTPASGAKQDFWGNMLSSGIIRYNVTAQDGSVQLYQVVVGTDDPRIAVGLNGPYTPSGQNTVVPGQVGTMTFTAINYGLVPADDLALVLTTPEGFTPADLTVYYEGVASTYDPATGWWRIPHVDAATIQNNTLVGGGARLMITFAVPATAKTGDHFTFHGQVINVNGKPLTPGMLSYDSVSKADFLVVAADESWPLPYIDHQEWNSGGDNHEYTMTLLTYGTAELTGVTAVHKIPDGFTLVSATPTVGTYDPATGNWTIDSFTPTGNIWESPALTMVVTPAVDPVPTPITLSLQIPKVYGVAPDPALGITEYVGLSDAPALRLNAEADVSTAVPGATVVHTLTLGTNNDVGVFGAKVAVTLPAHATLKSAVSPGGGTFDKATGVWTAAPIGSGVKSTLTLTYVIDATAPDKTEVTTAAIAAAIPTLGFANPASALVTTTVNSSGPAPCAGVDGGLTSGDTLVPWSGNGGYDVSHYGIDLTYHPAAGTANATIDATTTIDARVTGQPLCSFGFDLLGLTVTSVTVNGTPAGFSRIQDTDANHYKLVVTPAAAVSGDFEVAVAYGGEPQQFTFNGSSPFTVGWVPDVDGGGVGLGEPVGAFAWYPVNATPADRASYTTSLTVPKDWEAVAIGKLVSTSAVNPDQDKWVWDEPDNVPSSFTIAAIGQYEAHKDTHTTPGGTVVPLDIYADPIAGALAHYMDLTKELLDWGEARFGPYQPSVAGYILKPVTLNYALEVYGKPFYTFNPGDPTYIHEFAHQWGGNSVSLADWSDLWLAEGFASYMPWLWNETHGGPTVAEQAQAVYNYPDANPLWSVAPAAMRNQSDMFGNWVYEGGALALAALREGIGPDLMDEVMLKWFTTKAGQVASTQDFIDLAESVSGADLTGWAHDYLYTTGKPPSWPAAGSYLPTVPVQDLSAAVVSAADAAYTGAALTPVVTVKLGTDTLVEGTDYTVAYFDNTDAGTATVTVTGKGGYKGTATGHFTIAPRVITFAVDPIADQTATGSAITPAVAVRDGTTLLPASAYTVSYANNVDPGTATVTVTGTGNYAGSTGTATFTITTVIQPAKHQTLTFAKTGVSVTVGDAPFTNGLTHVGGGALTFSTADPAVATVDTAGLVTIVGTGNTSITVVAAEVPGEWLAASASYDVTVAPAPPQDLSAAVVSAADSAYTGSPLTPAVTVKLGTATLVQGTDYTVAYSNNTDAGTATVTVTGKGNYTGTATGHFTIAPRVITLVVDPIADQKATGGPLTPAVVVRDGTTPLPASAYTVSYANNVDPGTASVAVTGTGNYAGSTGTATFNITSTVQPVTLTLSATTWSLAAGAATQDVTVTTNQGAWTATSDQAWLTTTVRGTTLTLSASANPLTTARTATVTVTAGTATATLTVTQAGGTEPPPAPPPGPTTQVPSGGTAQPNLGWLAALLITGAGITLLGLRVGERTTT